MADEGIRRDVDRARLVNGIGFGELFLRFECCSLDRFTFLILIVFFYLLNLMQEKSIGI